MSTYAWVDLGAVLIPVLFSFHPRLRFNEQWRPTTIAILGILLFFLPWDSRFTSMGVWGFNPAHVWSTRWFHLPLEEWLFFICIPYACLFTYHCLPVLGVKDPFGKKARPVGAALAIALLIVAMIGRERAYTCSAGASLAIWLAFTALVQKAHWLGRYFITWLILLLPFLVVNGILTGTGLQDAVVWYDDAENLGIRILTLPVEDVLYGMLMMGLAVALYEEAQRIRWRSHPGS